MKTLTYRDKFRAEHPDGDAELIHIFRCPTNPATGKPVDCVPFSTADACRACWDCEIEEETMMTNKPCPVDRGKLLIGLECCRAIKCQDGCPYSEVGCDEIAVDALAYINYLEEQLHAKADTSD